MPVAECSHHDHVPEVVAVAEVVEHPGPEPLWELSQVDEGSQHQQTVHYTHFGKEEL